MADRSPSPPTRRRVLLSGAAGLTALAAGCVGDSGDGSGDDGADDTDTDDQFETVQLGPTSERPFWAQADPDRPGVVSLYDSVDDIGRGRAMLDGEFEDEIEQFVDETEFETQRLLRIEAVGPNGCYDRLRLENLTVADGTVRGEATATTPEDHGECPQVVTYQRAFVRVDAPVDIAEFELTDGWGETATVRSDEQLRLDPDQLSGVVGPAGAPPAVPEPLACDLQRKAQVSDEDEIVRGNKPEEPAFALRVGQASYEYGDTATIQLTNTTTDRLVTGNQYKYNLQLYTENGWQDIRVFSDDARGYTDEGIVHPPGEGFEWTVPLTEDGVLTDHILEENLEVCPDLQTGRYRFLFWPTDLAVEFDLVVSE